MSPRGAAVLCAFGDLEAGAAGLAWDLGDPGAVLLRDGEPRPATFAIEESGDAAAVTLTAEEASAEANFAPRDAPLPLTLDDEAGGGFTVTGGTAEVLLGGKTHQSPGLLARWQQDPLSGAGTFRFVTVDAGEGSLLVAASRGEAGASGHGEEGARAWQLRGEEDVPFEEALISTQYDGDDHPTRIGLELWPHDADQSSRAAAVRVAGSVLGGARSGGSWAGLFRCHTDGTEGIGAYLLWRA